MSSQRKMLLRMIVAGADLKTPRPQVYYQIEASREGESLLLAVGRGKPGTRAPVEPVTEMLLARGALTTLLDVLAAFTTEIRAQPALEMEARLSNLEPGFG